MGKASEYEFVTRPWTATRVLKVSILLIVAVVVIFAGLFAYIAGSVFTAALFSKWIGIPREKNVIICGVVFGGAMYLIMLEWLALATSRRRRNRKRNRSAHDPLR